MAATHVVTWWHFVVMFLLLKCFSASDTSNSVAGVDAKNVNVSLPTDTSKIQPEKNVTAGASNTSEHSGNDTTGANFPFGSVPRKMDSGALLRGFYVLVGVCAVIIIYVVVKMIRLRRLRSTTVRKYGVLASQEDLEMAPLDADDEEEDTTLFDASRRNQL